jgi:hypothetical protein
MFSLELMSHGEITLVSANAHTERGFAQNRCTGETFQAKGQAKIV